MIEMRIPGIERLFSIVNAKFRQAVAEPRPEKPGHQRDKVEISDKAHQVLAAKLSTVDPKARAAMVAKIKEAYRSGELEIDAKGIAREMEKHGYFDDIT